MLRAPTRIAQGLATYSARDEFNQAAGVLTGKVLPVGGTWTVVTGSDSDDFSVVSGGTVQRTSTGSDTGTGVLLTVGRAVTAGSTSYSAIAAQIDTKSWPIGMQGYSGLVMRLSDLDDYVAVAIGWSTAPWLQFNMYIAGVSTQYYTGTLPLAMGGTWYTLGSQIDAGGNFQVWLQPQGSVTNVRLSGNEVALATGGTRASGRVGFGDYVIIGSGTREYKNFAAWVPTSDAVLYPSQSAQLTTRNGMLREDSTGTAYGPVTWVEGDLPRLPISGREQRSVQVMIKSSRGDFQAIPDRAIDDVSVRGNYRPCWLYVPHSVDIPLDLPGIELWLKPELLPSGGAAIASWTDSSGSGNNAVQATGGLQPVATASFLDGYPGATFDGLDDLLLVAGVKNDAPQRTIFVVAQATALASSDAVWGWATTSCVRPESATQWRYATNQAGGSSDLGGSPLTADALVIRYNSTSSANCFINGGAATSFDPSDGYQSGSGSLGIGNEAGGTRPFTGTIVEAFSCNTALPDAYLNRMLGYLSRKFPSLGSFGT